MKTANGSYFAAECNWISKFSQNGKNYVFFEKHRFVFRKNSWFFKIAKFLRKKLLKVAKEICSVANMGYKATEKSKTSQNVQKLVLFAKSSKMGYKATEKSKTSQNVQKLVLLKEINVFFEKKLWFFWKVAEGSKFTVEWNWISKMYQTLKI